ncbi:3D domain-containing protein [Paenibacillus senegalensis]|uniref:3D domain-containing protein n=1 Tax=Paenibacillus senegalensis TaxID=1465766 RepID=UPI000287B387|nr:3D domain-containing protein [Paenibacillus senegalensis]
MGEIQVENTHVKRSSSTSLALRWKHENLRLVSLTLLASMALALLFIVLLYGTATKKISLVVDGKEMIVQTRHWVLGDLLEEQGIQVRSKDRISAELDRKLSSGDRFIIDHTSPVQVIADGRIVTMHTTGTTVGGALEDLNIDLGEHDKLIPEANTLLDSDSPIQIVRVVKEIEEKQVPVEFQTLTQEDKDLLKGKEKIVQEGKEGSKLVQTEKVYEDGKLVAENIINETVTEESVNKIIAIGSKNPTVAVLSAKAEGPSGTVTKDGAPINYQKVLNNVTLTAYSADAASTGKNPGDPGYGITASGTTVTEGRTIAVDKDVIPMGWWVYIDGIGYRRAEDTGGAIKGNKIDVYFDSHSYASKFGVKRGYTVYVIGPNKPSVD